MKFGTSVSSLKVSQFIILLVAVLVITGVITSFFAKKYMASKAKYDSNKAVPAQDQTTETTTTTAGRGGRLTYVRTRR